MLKVWNATLVVATFSLALLGTFLVRSGVLQSIHAFGASTVGAPILVLIAVVADRFDGIDRLPPRRPALGEADRLAVLARVDLPRQQPAAGLALPGDLLGHVVPADLGAVHRRQGIAGGALVRPLHHPAGGPAGPVHRNRPAAGLAASQLGVGAARLRRPGDRSAGRRPRRRASVRRRTQALGASAVRLRGLRAHRAGPGALARRLGSPGAFGRVDAGGDVCGRRPQPAPLRRLHRPRRHRRAAGRRRRLLELSDQPRDQPAARAGDDDRRLPGRLQAADRQRRQRAHRLRGGAQRAPRATSTSRSIQPGATSGRRASRSSGRSAPSSTASRPARSACAAASATTSGPRCSRTSHRCCATPAAPTAASRCWLAPVCATRWRAGTRPGSAARRRSCG